MEERESGGMVLALGAKPNLGPEEAATPNPQRRIANRQVVN